MFGFTPHHSGFLLLGINHLGTRRFATQTQIYSYRMIYITKIHNIHTSNTFVNIWYTMCIAVYYIYCIMILQNTVYLIYASQPVVTTGAGHALQAIERVKRQIFETMPNIYLICLYNMILLYSIWVTHNTLGMPCKQIWGQEGFWRFWR